MRVRRLVFLLTFVGLSAGCTAGQPAEAPSVAGPPTLPIGRARPANETTSAHEESTRAPSPLPIAVRVLSDDPRDVVLRAADLPEGFYLSAEYPTDRVELWPVGQQLVDTPLRSVQISLRSITAVGAHTVLARSDGADAEGLVSVATSAVRYERTAWAASAFDSALESSSSALEDPSAMIDTRTGDNARAWRYRLVGAVIDQVLVHTRNYLLAVTLVRHPALGEPILARRYARLLRSKLRD
jgi:hypothetical protein